MTVVYVIVNTVAILLAVLQFMMLARVIMSWFIHDEDSVIMNFLYYVTEPVVVPVRLILGRFEAIQNMPIDISFMVAMLLLIIIQYLLPTSFAF